MPSDDPNDHYEAFIPKPLPPPHGRLSVQLGLLALTLLSTTFAGGCHYYNFSLDLATADVAQTNGPSLSALFSQPMFYVRGLWYSLTILAILGCHEMGHYIACLRYGVVATRPYFLPAPVLLTGTLGAFIRIKSRIPNKTALFNRLSGARAPIVGFVDRQNHRHAGIARRLGDVFVAGDQPFAPVDHHHD